MVLFQWDAQKSALNFVKHGILFEEAFSVFLDQNSTEYFDKAHSQFEDRFLIMGVSANGRLLMVVYTFRRSANGKKDFYRIIRARLADKKEKQTYNEGR